MKWMEIIKLRTSGRGELMKALDTCKRIFRAHQAEQAESVIVLKNTLLDTDLCVCIAWENSGDPCEPSLLGRQLMGIFANFGIANHSLWFPEDNMNCVWELNPQKLKGA